MAKRKENIQEIIKTQQMVKLKQEIRYNAYGSGADSEYISSETVLMLYLLCSLGTVGN